MGGVIYQKRFLGTVGNGLCAVPQMQRIDHRTPANPQEPTTCHPERAKRAEGSSHLPPAQELPGAKILRLRASPFAQDDKLSTGSSFITMTYFFFCV